MKLFKVIFIILAIIMVSGHASGIEEKHIFTSQQWYESAKKYDYSENYKTPKLKNTPNKHSSGFLNALFSKFSNIKFIFILVVIAVLVFLLILLILGLYKDSGEKFKNNTKTNSLDIDNIDTADLENLLIQAINEGSFRDAVRYRYLILIRTLNENKLIAWKKNKTNGHYMKEMSENKGFEIFRFLTFKFDCFWYGEYNVKEADYQSLIPLYDKINNLITGYEK